MASASTAIQMTPSSILVLNTTVPFLPTACHLLFSSTLLQNYRRTMSASEIQESSDVRIAHTLHTKEEEFVHKRRETVFQALQNLKIPCSKNEVPHIALLGSGGGQRAMVALLGSLVQLYEEDLLDCILYLSGVSGSTWCMASLYQEPDWSTKLETVKDKIIERLSGPQVSWGEARTKLKEYHYGKDFFSLTDVWAVMAVITFVKEIDECKLSEQWDHLSKDPFPIYTVVDKQCKQHEDVCVDPWFEITPHEAGYSLSGAFVETSSFGCQFDKGHKIKDQPEMDMLYLQSLCGSCLADGDEIHKFLWDKISEFLHRSSHSEMKNEDPKTPPVDKCHQALMDLADMNLCVLNDQDPSHLDQSLRTTLDDLDGYQLGFPTENMNPADKQAVKHLVNQHTKNVSNHLSRYSSMPDIQILTHIFKCMTSWIWGRHYNFLHNMKDEAVPAALQEGETRDYEDSGLLNNSPYFSVLREERHIDLIISLDFSDGDPFMTVKKAAEMSKKLNLSFPEVNIPSEDVDNPKDFYVFKGKNAPTVIHIPLFNVVNCGGEIDYWRNKYRIVQDPYSAEKIIDLMKVAGKNISNNREKIKEQIQAIIG
ncbi:hypothetical protein QQF64_026402 [Cirrhinus molitorella]|uniref:PLA2c domain-containing protein n=1 Tax=Cirrhinus molitorella TaxID=172907 RepID=A0ABR3N9H0_9TELE